MAFWNRSKSRFSSPVFNAGDTKGFWQWFSQNEVELASGFTSYFAGQNRDDAHGDELGGALKRFHPELVFEMGKLESGKLDFVISADGIFDNFPAVLSLYRGSPESSRFQFTAFRQRAPHLSLSMFGETFQAETTQFTIKPSEYHEGKFDLTVFMGHFPLDLKQLRHAAFILLDTAIGEYDMETLIGGFEVLEVPPAFETSARPLTELPAYLDESLGSLKRH